MTQTHWLENIHSKAQKKDKVGYKVKRNHIPIVITRHGANTWTSDRLIPGRMK